MPKTIMILLVDNIKLLLTAVLLLCFSFIACNKQELKSKDSKVNFGKRNLKQVTYNVFEDTIHFKNIETLSPSIVQEIRYADTNNFTGIKIYDCPACFLQNEVAFSLAKAQKLAKEKNLSIKVFDCYRAYDYQVKLYNAFPNFNYVAKPSKGSMHSLGCAVDLTLVDTLGNELDMGTTFDSFDKKSFTFASNIDSLAKYNREVLRTIMTEVGFRPIKTEWWHFSYINCNKKVDDNLKWTCN